MSSFYCSIGKVRAFHTRPHRHGSDEAHGAPHVPFTTVQHHRNYSLGEPTEPEAPATAVAAMTAAPSPEPSALLSIVQLTPSSRNVSFTYCTAPHDNTAVSRQSSPRSNSAGQVPALASGNLGYRLYTEPSTPATQSVASAPIFMTQPAMPTATDRTETAHTSQQRFSSSTGS